MPSVLVVLAAGVIATLARGQTIHSIGPIALEPAMTMATFFALPCALAVGAACGGGLAAITTRTPRTVIARLGALAMVALLAMAWTAVIAGLSAEANFVVTVRSMCALAAPGLLVAAFLGPKTAFIPTVVVFGLAVTSPVDGGPLSLYRLVLDPTVHAGTVAVAVGVCALAAVLVALDPLHRQHLPGGRHVTQG